MLYNGLQHVTRVTRSKTLLRTDFAILSTCTFALIIYLITCSGVTFALFFMFIFIFLHTQFFFQIGYLNRDIFCATLVIVAVGIYFYTRTGSKKQLMILNQHVTEKLSCLV
jgi:hypothetical protein